MPTQTKPVLLKYLNKNLAKYISKNNFIGLSK